MAHHEPPGLGLKKKIKPAEQDLAVVLHKFNGILDNHLVRAESGAEMLPEASCTLDCVSRRNCPFTSPVSDKFSSRYN